jgi:hypothetical protein
MESNKVSNQVKYIATTLMLMKQKELLLEDVSKAFMASERQSKLLDEDFRQLCKAFDLDDCEEQALYQFETDNAQIQTRWDAKLGRSKKVWRSKGPSWK